MPVDPAMSFSRQIALWLALTMCSSLVTPSRAAEQEPPSGVSDTSGVALMEWAYDSWTVPWVQVRGVAPALAPASHATLMSLACETANLERDRIARHLSVEECDHRMAAILADRDSALIFRLDLRIIRLPRNGSTCSARAGSDVPPGG